MEVPWFQVLLTGIAAAGGVAGIIRVLAYISRRLDRRKNLRAEEKALELSNSVEMRKLEGEAALRNEQVLWKIIEKKEQEVEDLKHEIRELQHLHALSRPVIAKIYSAYRNLRRQIDVLDLLVIREADNSDLAAEMEILRQKLDQLEASLP